MKHKSVHAYLDEVFKDHWAVSDDEILAAKKDYWRMYNTDLKARQRSARREFSVWFTGEEFAKIQERITEDLPISGFIRQATLEYMGMSVQKSLVSSHPVIEQQLVLISGLLEEALIEELLSDLAVKNIQESTSQIKSYLLKVDCEV